MRTRILVVDDEPDILELLHFNLTAHGYEVSVAHNGLEALNLARQYLPDLIVLDLMMPGMDGYTVCEILRRQPSTRRTPVIILTSLGGQVARYNGLASGAQDFINKPFSPHDLVQRLNAVLAAHQAQMEAEASRQAANADDLHTRLG